MLSGVALHQPARPLESASLIEADACQRCLQMDFANLPREGNLFEGAEEHVSDPASLRRRRDEEGDQVGSVQGNRAEDHFATAGDQALPLLSQFRDAGDIEAGKRAVPVGRQVLAGGVDAVPAGYGPGRGFARRRRR